VKHKHLALTLGAIFTSIVLLLFSCKKLNESTAIGGGLIPEVDNITTFDTILTVEAYNDTFTLATDTTLYSSSYTHYLGQINSDPFFGKSDAKIFLELLPPNDRYTFINKADSLHIDSVVLVLNYVETWGDTTVDQTINVYEMAQGSEFADTNHIVRKSNYPKAGLLGSRTVKPFQLNDSIQNYKDTTSHQLRVRLDNAFGQRLLAYDTTSSGPNNAYYSDSVFRKFVKGFAVESTSGEALMGFNLEGDNTKLAIYYKDDNGDSPVEKWDTAVAYFAFNASANNASANYIARDYTGSALAAAVGGSAPDDLVYIQSTPGSFATIKIPGLAGLNNNLIHRAELIMEQVYDGSDTLFPPTNLYLDAYDPVIPGFRTIPYDVTFDATGNTNLGDFGIAPINTKDLAGRVVKSWRFNLTRYVQHIVNDTEKVYDLRLFSPFSVSERYGIGELSSSSSKIPFTINSSIGKGRVRLAGNTGPADTNPQRMRLRIVYSKI
jgi:hypothetical protein